MDAVSAYDYEFALETERLMLRPWHASEARIQHELWAERDPRVPPSRRIGPDGRPTVEDLAEDIRRSDVSDALGLLAAEGKATGDVIGYAGLIEGCGPVGEPELAFEFLRAHWGQGYATEASWAALGWAHASGYRRVWARVSDWNAAARRVLTKLGFAQTERVEDDEPHGKTLYLSKRL